MYIIPTKIAINAHPFPPEGTGSITHVQREQFVSGRSDVSRRPETGDGQPAEHAVADGAACTPGRAVREHGGAVLVAVRGAGPEQFRFDGVTVVGRRHKNPTQVQ